MPDDPPERPQAADHAAPEAPKDEIKGTWADAGDDDEEEELPHHQGGEKEEREGEHHHHHHGGEEAGEHREEHGGQVRAGKYYTKYPRGGYQQRGGYGRGWDQGAEGGGYEHPRGGYYKKRGGGRGGPRGGRAKEFQDSDEEEPESHEVDEDGFQFKGDRKKSTHHQDPYQYRQYNRGPRGGDYRGHKRGGYRGEQHRGGERGAYRRGGYENRGGHDRGNYRGARYQRGAPAPAPAAAPEAAE